MIPYDMMRRVNSIRYILVGQESRGEERKRGDELKEKTIIDEKVEEEEVKKGEERGRATILTK